MTRLADATPRLAEFISKAQHRRFSWRSWNCCIFAGRATYAVTGCDPNALFPRYRSRAQAETILRDSGGMESLIDKALTGLAERVHPSRATYGDILLHDFGRGPQPAVCVGVHCLAPGRSGLERRLTLNALAAWKI